MSTPSDTSNSVLQPLPSGADQPVFDEQWQAQALAMADLLIQSGQIEATDWSLTLGKYLKQWQSEADNMTSYYRAVLAALAELINQQKLLSMDQIAQREEDWKTAYLSTPHGQPVKLSGD